MIQTFAAVLEPIAPKESDAKNKGGKTPHRNPAKKGGMGAGASGGGSTGTAGTGTPGTAGGSRPTVKKGVLQRTASLMRRASLVPEQLKHVLRGPEGEMITLDCEVENRPGAYVKVCVSVRVCVCVCVCLGFCM